MRRLYILEIRMNEINEMIESFNPFKKRYNILVVANISERISCQKDYVEHSFDSEFFSKAELAQILSAITSIFGYVRTFFTETEFIKYVLDNLAVLKSDTTLVYNFARDGIHEGKKSLIPSFCDLYGIKYTGSNAFVISLMRNKYIYSKLFTACGVPVPETFKYDAQNCQFDSPVTKGKFIIKNVSQAASRFMSEQNLVNAETSNAILEQVNNFCKRHALDEVILQKYIEGTENECEVLVIKIKNKYIAMPPVGLKLSKGEILTEQISNSYAYSFFSLNEQYPDEIINSICHDSKKAASVLGIKTYARFDYKIDRNGKHYLIDIAGTPYAIEHSSIAFLFQKILNLKYCDFFKLLAAIEDDY